MPKYTDIRVDNEINCSSSYHHSVRVYCKVNGGFNGRKIWYLFNGFETDTSYGYVEFPKYFEREVYSQLIALFESGKARIFEYDCDGNKRYENLRYHYDGFIEHQIGVLKGYLL